MRIACESGWVGLGRPWLGNEDEVTVAGTWKGNMQRDWRREGRYLPAVYAALTADKLSELCHSLSTFPTTVTRRPDSPPTPGYEPHCNPASRDEVAYPASDKSMTIVAGAQQP